MRLRLALALGATLAVAGPGWAGETIRCTATGQEPVTVSLKSKLFKGRVLSCLSGSFVADITPCAPQGAFALSAPTGSAAIVGIVNRWQDYAVHDGGVVSFFQTSDKIAFAGGFNNPNTGFYNDWSFQIDRFSGQAKLDQKGKSSVAFQCNKAAVKF